MNMRTNIKKVYFVNSTFTQNKNIQSTDKLVLDLKSRKIYEKYKIYKI